MTSEFALVLLVAAVSVATTALTLFLASWVQQRRAGAAIAARLLSERSSGVAFLFDDERLLDATPAARDFLAAAGDARSDWARLASLLRHRLPGFDAAFARLAAEGEVRLTAADESRLSVVGEWRNGLARVVISHAGEDALSDPAEHLIAEAREAELSALREVTGAAPAAIWKQAPDGTVSWANSGYFALVAEVLSPAEASLWPPPPLFALATTGFAEGRAAPVRAGLQPADGGPQRWFECHAFHSDSETLFYAFPADSLIRAEEALREFVQTLSKTFADLPIGLAVFDRARRLALFNPALMDLTGLEIDFLTAHPTLFGFLDRLRERRKIPETRDYPSWRQRMSELESAAADGFVREDWPLPSGQTFRVTGRPHPDGAVAFLFEDVTAEVSLTRRFRRELELGQSVIDSLDEAIAVFSPAGTIVVSNAAYAALWGIDPTATLLETTAAEATRLWQSRCAPTPIWGDARDFIGHACERADWSGKVMLRDGRALTCRFQPLPGGSRLVGFSEVRTSAGERRRPQRRVPAARVSA